MAKILLVDDREDNLISIESILEPGGYQFVKANSGAKALKILLTEYDFALILMDVKMPNINGFETAAMIYSRDKLKHIPIIFITAQGYDAENAYKGYSAGAVDYIYKPINPDILRAKVAVFVELYSKTRQLAMQEQKLITINKSLENEIKERKISEENVKQLNIKLLENIDKLEEANKDLDNFAFIASHDLHEPLRKIQTFISLIQKEEISNMSMAGREYLKRMTASTNRMRSLIDDLLSYSRTNTGGQVFEIVNLKELMDVVHQELSLVIEEKNATIKSTSLPKLFVQKEQFKQLLINLIGNSLKYTRDGVEPLIHVKSEKVKLNEVPGVTDGVNKVFYKISISDNGIGFEPEYAERIFVLFQRLHHQSEYSGTGIGLAICKKIVENHNGLITAEGKPGAGSTFNIFLTQAIEA